MSRSLNSTGSTVGEAVLLMVLVLHFIASRARKKNVTPIIDLM